MENNKIIIFSLMLFILVLIGVTIIQPLGNYFSWLEAFAPMIVITGFFVFIIAVSLFVYAIIGNLRNKTQ